MCAYQSRIDQLLTGTVRKMGGWGSTACKLSEAAIFNKEDGSCLAKSPGFPAASADDIQGVLDLLSGYVRNEDSFMLGEGYFSNLEVKEEKGKEYLIGQDDNLPAPILMAFSGASALVIVLHEHEILMYSVMKVIASAAGDL
eukprot:jgi/Botrbrau1/23011/Bobra.136_1s0003.1